MKKSGIEWTDATWSPVTGCTKVSAGCKNCYAEREVNGRWSKNPKSIFFGRDFSDVQTHESQLFIPLQWKKPRRIFVCPRGDLFHESVPDEFIDHVFAIMALCTQHTFQVLTKRPERMLAYFSNESAVRLVSKPTTNVWLGVSIEDQQSADLRIPLLLNTPAAVRWVSAEPLIAYVCMERIFRPDKNYVEDFVPPSIDWVVVGGESGNLARPMHPDWVRGLRNQCEATGVPFLFKQWGEWKLTEGGAGYTRVGVKQAGRLLDEKLHDEYPSVSS